VRLRVTGRIQDLPKAVRAELERVMEATKHYEKGHLILALSYGGRTEIVDAVRTIAAKVKAGRLNSIPRRSTKRRFRATCTCPTCPTPT
jgi:undecaprenyl diphosphate synthase